MKVKKKYCLNIASYKYKSGFKQLLPPIILKESNNLNINILNLVPTQNRCPCGKNCPNYKIIFELKQEIIKLIDKISQLKKITEFSIPITNIENSKTSCNESHTTPERDLEKKSEKKRQFFNSFRNSSKNKLLEAKKGSYSNNNLFKYNLLRSDKINLRPNSAKNSQLKDALDKMFYKEKEKEKEKEKGKEKEKEKNKLSVKKEENKIQNLTNIINKRLNMNLFSSSMQERSENTLRNNNHRYEADTIENNSYSRNMKIFNHESFSSLGKNKVNELSSLNLHFSNNIISPAIKITPKNLFDSISSNDANKENKIMNENKYNLL